MSGWIRVWKKKTVAEQDMTDNWRICLCDDCCARSDERRKLRAERIKALRKNMRTVK